MTRIVEDLTLLAKAEAPDFLRLETIDVPSLAAELHAKASALAPRTWTLAVDGGGTIVGDRQRLTQAIVQLSQNAVQHTREGDEIALGASVNGVEARFRVTDRGPGIQPAEQERIFDRFARGSGSRRLDGSGLGLAIVRAIAEAHGGRVELDSRPGWGSTFTVVVPARERA
jgi:signal transduction histidine kinase